MSEQPHHLETLYKELALTLGDAVWAFARIEWLTYSCLRSLLRDRLDELVGDLNFRNRSAILRRLVDGKNSSQDKKERANKAIKAAEELSDRRNIIVHNPWQIWVDLDTEQFMTQIEKYSQ
jgi:Arc/MetJ-type ribon-helix-helix transcriptional regulator